MNNFLSKIKFIGQKMICNPTWIEIYILNTTKLVMKFLKRNLFLELAIKILVAPVTILFGKTNQKTRWFVQRIHTKYILSC